MSRRLKARREPTMNETFILDVFTDYV